jgi:hypothetical protein
MPSKDVVFPGYELRLLIKPLVISQPPVIVVPRSGNFCMVVAICLSLNHNTNFTILP